MKKYFYLIVYMLTAVLFVGCDSRQDTAGDLPPVINPEKLELALPDFSSFADVNMKKQQFFEFMLPVILEENEHILVLRESVQQVFSRFDENIELLEIEVNWISSLAKSYELSQTCETITDVCRDLLLRRIDIIPPSLILAQAANESAWGTSRFATEGNNLFGQWCFSRGCGIVPLQQEDGPHYEVKAFDTIQGSVRGYLMNLNTHRSYMELRVIREGLREQGKSITGAPLAKGLSKYSIRGEEYIQEIRQMIRFNGLERYDLMLLQDPDPSAQVFSGQQAA